MRYDEDERVASCQREIQRLRLVVRELYDDLKKNKEIARKSLIALGESANCDPKGDQFKRILESIDVTEEEYESIMEE